MIASASPSRGEISTEPGDSHQFGLHPALGEGLGRDAGVRRRDASPLEVLDARRAVLHRDGGLQRARPVTEAQQHLDVAVALGDQVQAR
jgi:hypothetical protein